MYVIEYLLNEKVCNKESSFYYASSFDSLIYNLTRIGMEYLEDRYFQNDDLINPSRVTDTFLILNGTRIDDDIVVYPIEIDIDVFEVLADLEKDESDRQTYHEYLYKTLNTVLSEEYMLGKRSQLTIHGHSPCKGNILHIIIDDNKYLVWYISKGKYTKDIYVKNYYKCDGFGSMVRIKCI